LFFNDIANRAIFMTGKVRKRRAKYVRYETSSRKCDSLDTSMTHSVPGKNLRRHGNKRP